MKSFFSSALQPALHYEGESVPEGTTPFLLSILASLGRTMSLALVAMSLALPLGLLLGLAAAKSPIRQGREGAWSRAFRLSARMLAALFRSVHELLWAVLLLAALGLGSGPAVLALALPYAGILAKIFAELIEESSTAPPRGVREAGASRGLTFFAATLPTAAPDMAAYAFYRLECAVRSAAVLGFFGLPTLGLRLQASFASSHYREVWTELYALFFLVLIFEGWSGLLRRRRADASSLELNQNSGLSELRRMRPKNRFLRASVFICLVAGAVAWSFEWSGLFGPESLLDARRLENLKRFVTVDLVPSPLRSGESSLLAWVADLWRDGGARGLGVTLSIAITALCGAVLGSGLFVFAGAHNMMRHAAVRAIARGVCVFLRAIPELFWAFLFVELFGPGAFPAIVALALHNAGILGRLGADLIENLDSRPKLALEGGGASRAQTAFVAVTPEGLPRYLTFVFYRLETCVRESTVLGLVGVVSLGWFVQDARARQRYDLVLYYVGLGALIVLAADVASALVRRWIREA